MTKADLIKAAAKKAGYTQEAAAAIINAAIETAGDSLLQGFPVKLPKFGMLETRQRKPRTSRNFKTGEAVSIPARLTVVFTPALEMRQRLNGKAGNDDD